MALDFNNIVSDAETAREKELQTTLGGPLLDLKAFLEGTETHHRKMEVLRKLEAILRDPSSVVTLPTDSNGQKARALGGGTDDSSTTDTPEVQQLIALARQYPDRASFLSAVLQELSQLDPAVADITVRLTSKVAQREPGWEAIPHPRTGEPTTQTLLDAELRIAELERQVAAANRAIADIAAKGATPLREALEMARRLSLGPVDNVDPTDAVTLYRNLEDLQLAVANAAGPGTTTGRTTTGRRTRP